MASGGNANKKMRRVRNAWELLTPKQRTDLRKDLNDIAQARREAEARSGTLRLS